MGFSLFISALKESYAKGYYIERSIIYMILGTIIGIVIYLFDYRKLKKYSFLIYLFVTILMLFPIIAFMGIVLTQSLDGIPTRVLSSFNPEINPYNTGWVGMQQKEIINNAKLVGETEVNLGNNLNIEDIFEESCYTFIYLLGKTGIIPATILVLAIILTSIRLIINVKNIKEQYGKFLIVGLSTLYIFQSVTSVLMNINIGIQARIEIPLVAYGEFYFLINILSMALILSVYRRKDINFEEPKKSKLYVIIERLCEKC